MVQILVFGPPMFCTFWFSLILSQIFHWIQIHVLWVLVFNFITIWSWDINSCVLYDLVFNFYHNFFMGYIKFMCFVRVGFHWFYHNFFVLGYKSIRRMQCNVWFKIVAIFRSVISPSVDGIFWRVRSPRVDVFEKVELLLKTNQFESFACTLIVLY
jgi:hypothetical protein